MTLVESKVVKKENFDIFLIFAQNIDCGYMLDPVTQQLTDRQLTE